MRATGKTTRPLYLEERSLARTRAVLALAVMLAPVLACAQPAGSALGASGNAFVMVCRALLAFVAGLLLLYSLRHYWFALTRMFRPQVPLHASIETANWPRVVVLIAAHNEEAVIGDCIDALLHCDYPSDRLVLMPVNDRSTDGTRAVIEHYAARYPGRLHPYHRSAGAPGKAAALKDATDIVTGNRFRQLRDSEDEREAHQELLQAEEAEIARVRALKAATEYVQAQDVADLIIVFDADYLPNRQLIKQLAAPFFDPEVGAVMGRVVPQNVGVNLLTRILDLERSAGYQVDQQARYCLGSVPQYGGTVGGVRLSALADAGGWTIDTLAEDTDLTYRLLLKGWHTAYLNHAECYEEVPQSWEVRFRQISRWAKGHNAAMMTYFGRVLRSGDLSRLQRLDGLALLGVFFMSPLLLLGWLLSAVLALTGVDFAQGLQSWELWFLIFVTTLALAGNFAAFVQVAVASHLDGYHERIRLLPLMFCGFLVSMMAITKASVDGLFLDRLLRRKLQWDKTARFRHPDSGRGEAAP